MSRAIVEQFFFLLGEGDDVEGWLGLLSPNIVVDTPFSPKGDAVRFEGIDAVTHRFADARRRMQALRFHDMEILATEDRERWVVTCRSTGRMADGGPYHNEYCWILRISLGKVVWWCEYFDPQEVIAVRPGRARP